MKNFLIGGKILLTSILFVVSITIVSAITPSSGGGGGGPIQVILNSTGQTIILSPGWNTFSTPKVLDSITFQSGGTGLFFYSLTSTGWQTIVPTKDNVKPLEGFMINNTNLTNSTISLTYKQNLTPLETIFQKQLHAGWNILGVTTIYSPFSTIGTGGTMAVDFTRSSNGLTNYANKVSSDFYSRIGDISLGDTLLGESYGIFLSMDRIYGGIQSVENSGSVDNSNSTSTGVTANSLTVTLDGSAIAQYVPKNVSNVKIGSIKLTAGSSNVTIQSIVVSRSGLGNGNEIIASNGVRASQSGVIISSITDSYDSLTQKATIYFSSGLIIASGSSQTIDILVSLNGADNSQHQFSLTIVNTSNATVTGTPITLGLLNTTSYVTSTVTASLSQIASIIPENMSNQPFTKIDITAGARDSRINGFTLTRSGSTDFTKRLQNVKVYRNDVIVGTVSVSADSIFVNGLTDILAPGDTQSYELRGDTLVDANNSTLALKIDSTNDISATEVNTGYATSVIVGNYSINIAFGSVEFTFSKTSTGNVTISPGTNNIKFFDGKLETTTPVTIRQLTITSNTNDSGITAFINDQLSVKLNGSEIGVITSLVGNQYLTVSFDVDGVSPAILTIEGSTKNNTNIAPSSNQFTVAITEVRDSNNSIIANIGAGTQVTGDRTNILNGEIVLKSATIAAPPSTKIYSNASGLEIGRFAMQSQNETITVREITLTNGASSNGVNDFTRLISGTNIKLVNVADNSQISATVTINASEIKFTGMSINVAKDATANFKVLVDTQGDIITTASGNIALNIALVSASSSSNPTITLSSYQTTKTYSVSVIPPTVTLVKKDTNTFLMRITNVDADSDINLTSVTAQVRAVSVSNPSYQAYACIRDEGSADKCGLAAVTNKVQVIPGAGIAFTGTIDISGNTFPVTISKNSSITREIFVDSPFINPADLQAEITSINYSNSGGNMSFDEIYSVTAQ